MAVKDLVDRHPIELACRSRGNGRSAPATSARLGFELLLDHMWATLTVAVAAAMTVTLGLALAAGAIMF